MFLHFDGRIINVNAISELVTLEQNGEYKIIAIRIDGSYMAAESFTTENECISRYEFISDRLMSANLII